MTGYKSKRAAAQNKLDSMERKALKLAQQVLESLPGFRADIDNAIDAIKESLAQPAQEPVATIAVREHTPVGKVAYVLEVNLPVGIHKLYTAPTQRTWVDLTPQDLNAIFAVARTGEHAVRLALDKLKEVNNG